MTPLTQENLPGGGVQFMFMRPNSGEPSNVGLVFTSDPVVPFVPTK